MMIKSHSELSDLSDGDYGAYKAYELRILEGESCSDENDEEKRGKTVVVLDETKLLASGYVTVGCKRVRRTDVVDRFSIPLHTPFTSEWSTAKRPLLGLPLTQTTDVSAANGVMKEECGRQNGMKLSLLTSHASGQTACNLQQTAQNLQHALVEVRYAND
ncbi:hypothetical protein TNCV_738681 [Trichonephila clavipes]|nr:hypothetical protein TNCV_738681 [Trichonephila clavipes]